MVLAAIVSGLVVGAHWHRPILERLGHRGHAPAPAAGAAKTLYTCGMHPQVLQDRPGRCPICQMELVPVGAGAALAEGPKGERRVAYWWDPMMNPPFISDRPGKSPMGMDLVPVYEDEARGGDGVVIDPVVVQNMGVRVATAVEGPLRLPFRTVGILREAEPRTRDVVLKVAGYVERLRADTVGMLLRRGDPLFEVYSPELLVAQEELLAARRRLPAGAVADELLAAARTKLLLWDVAPEEVDAIEREGVSRRTVLFRSPQDGYLVEKEVFEGSAVEPGTKILRIVDQSLLWLDAQVYEEQLALVAVGQRLEASVKAFPDRRFEGTVARVLPRAEPTARTIAVRIELQNPDLALKPGMYAIVTGETVAAERALLIPREAVIDTGVRAVVFLDRGGGRFEPRDVKLGVESPEGTVQVLSGIAPSDRVVVSGQFLLDTESRLREAIRKMLDEGRVEKGAGTAAPAPPHDPPEAVDALVRAYLALARALAADEADRVPALAKALAEAAEPFAEARAAADLGEGLAAQRERFKALSAAVIAVAERTAPSEKLFVLHCPMAGAEWLQTDEEVRNPYFGAEMPGCGEVRRAIEPRHGGHGR